MSHPLPLGTPKSPCNGVCSLDSEGICRGCLRSKTEISQWSQFTNDQKLKCLALLNTYPTHA
jgi:predicted Fe-S protein YdhL (DUF1289 family)